MPDPAGTHADGAVQFGSQVVQINGHNYVFEKIDVKRGTRRILQNNEFGVPKKKVHVKNLIEGTSTLQFPDAAAPSPPTCTEDPVNGLFALIPAGGGAPK